MLAQLRQIAVLGNRAASDSQVGAFDDAHDRTVKIDELLQPVRAVVKAASPGRGGDRDGRGARSVTAPSTTT